MDGNRNRNETCLPEMCKETNECSDAGGTVKPGVRLTPTGSRTDEEGALCELRAMSVRRENDQSFQNPLGFSSLCRFLLNGMFGWGWH